MDVEIDGMEIEMAILSGMPVQHEYIITVLDALDEDNNCFLLDIVKRRQLQEKQRRKMHVSRNLELALLIPSREQQQPRKFICRYCLRYGHTKDQCWDKNLSSRPKRPSSSKPFLQKQCFLCGLRKIQFR